MTPELTHSLSKASNRKHKAFISYALAQPALAAEIIRKYRPHAHIDASTLKHYGSYAANADLSTYQLDAVYTAQIKHLEGLICIHHVLRPYRHTLLALGKQLECLQRHYCFTQKIKTVPIYSFIFYHCSHQACHPHVVWKALLRKERSTCRASHMNLKQLVTIHLSNTVQHSSDSILLQAFEAAIHFTYTPDIDSALYKVQSLTHQLLSHSHPDQNAFAEAVLRYVLCAHSSASRFQLISRIDHICRRVNMPSHKVMDG